MNILTWIKTHAIESLIKSYFSTWDMPFFSPLPVYLVISYLILWIPCSLSYHSTISNIRLSFPHGTRDILIKDHIWALHSLTQKQLKVWRWWASPNLNFILLVLPLLLTTRPILWLNQSPVCISSSHFNYLHLLPFSWNFCPCIEFGQFLHCFPQYPLLSNI